MRTRERLKPITVMPCECGHAEVVSGHQRACIASRKGMELAIKPVGSRFKETCPVCMGQITFDESNSNNRIIALNVQTEK